MTLSLEFKSWNVAPKVPSTAAEIELIAVQILAGAPRWSPDGTRISFDAHGSAGESSDIYVIDANGYGSPRRLSPPAADRVRPAWSADGRWIYFSSTQSGSRQIWRMPADGGAAVQMTRNGGVRLFRIA